MRLSNLLCFEAVKRYKHFSKAAEHLHLSQSAVSKQIASLEDHLGVILFERDSPSIRLTPIGERISPHVEAILLEYDKMVLEAKDYLKTEKQKLRIASFYEMAQYGITDLLVNFEHGKPGFHIESKECDHLEMLQLLDNRQTDMIIGYQELWNGAGIGTGYSTVPLRKDDLVLVVHESHPLAGEAAVALINVKDEMFCFSREDDSLFEFFRGLSTILCKLTFLTNIGCNPVSEMNGQL